MKRSLISVFIHTVVIIQSVGNVGTLLHLRKQSPFTDTVNRSGLYKVNLILLNRNSAKKIRQRFVPDGFFHFFPACISRKAIDYFAAGCRVENIPHFRFTQRSVLICRSICIVRMNLNGKVILCIDQFDQNRKFTAVIRIASKHLGIFFQYFRKSFPPENSTSDQGHACRVRRTFPGFRKGRHVDSFGKVII